MAKVYQTPGVYIKEQSVFPNSVVPVPTAVPAFVGYTEKAVRNKKDLTNIPVRLSSLGEYLQYFGGAPCTTFDIKANEGGYHLEPKSQRFFLFNNIRLFFANGGSDCYTVSVGDYSSEIALSHFLGEGAGTHTLLKEPEPTMLVIPDAVLLPQTDCFSLQQEMLRHCGQKMHNRVVILDIYKGYKPRNGDAGDVIDQFRSGIGNESLDFGTAYYPWLQATVVAFDEVDFRNIDPGTRPALIKMLKANNALQVKKGWLSEKSAEAINAEIDAISFAADSAGRTEDEKVFKTLHQTLLHLCPLYKEVMKRLEGELNLLPPSGAIAGLYAYVDNNLGVWKAPANVSLSSVLKPAVELNNEDQEDLNAPLNGKAVNAIRTFPGKGVLVWGARTLDGNSPEWRYISVRRTLIFIEQSINNAIQPFVFEPNTAATWTNIKALITNFLTNLWKQGALAGTVPEEGFNVEVGLGMTMTPQDILDGIIRISVRVAVTRPAEFIVVTFQLRVQSS